MNKKILNITILLFCAILLSSQEICDNAIDDDGDGLIDLNDEDCDCITRVPAVYVYDFENTSHCCPVGPAQLYCQATWQRVSMTSPDYFNVCDFVGGSTLPYAPIPFPSDMGCVGFYCSNIFGVQESEYIGTCLAFSIIEGETYNVSLQVGFNDNNSYASTSPFKVALYGRAGCSSTISTYSDCLGNHSEWTELVSFEASGGDSTWVKIDESFTPTGTYQMIALGAACDAISGPSDYHFIDDFIIDGTFGKIEEEPPLIFQAGDCIDGVTLTATHPDAISYQWYYEGIAIIGETQNTLLVDYPNIGTYTVVAYFNTGCALSAPIEVDIDPNVLEFGNLVLDVLCYGDSDGSILINNINSTSSPFTYFWEDASTLETLSGLPIGTYDVTVTDANGCYGSDMIEVNQPPPLEIHTFPIIHPVPPSTLGCAEISIIGGTPGYYIDWDNGNNNAKVNLEPGEHSVTVTDVNGCTEEVSVVINAPLAIGIDPQTPQCLNDCNGFATIDIVGGAAPYNILWSHGAVGDTIENLCPGIYTVTVTDQSNTGLTTEVEIPSFTPIDLTAEIANTFCPNEGLGFVNTLITSGIGPYNYKWSTGSDSTAIEQLPPGEYTLTIVDGNNCAYEFAYNIYEHDIINPNYSLVPSECQLSNGSISIDSIGGNGPFEINWSNGENGLTINQLAIGEFIVTITDVNQCKDIDTIDIVNASEVIVSVDILNNNCLEDEKGSMSIDNIIGVGPFEYLWNTGDKTASIDSLKSGVYTLTVTDANGCETVEQYQIDLISNLEQTGLVDHEICKGDNNGGITLNINSGLPPYSINWDNGAKSSAISSLSPGSYNVTITDSLNCPYLYQYDINTGIDVVATSVILQPSCYGLSNGSIDITPIGIAPFEYIWNNGVVTEDNLLVGQGQYTLEISDSLGCKTDYLFDIEEPIEISFSSDITHPGCDTMDIFGTAILSPSGGTGSLNINWEDGATSIMNNNLIPGYHNVTITDDNQCEHIDSLLIIEGIPLIAKSNVDSILCYGAEGSIEIQIQSGTSPYIFDWSDGNTDKIRTNIKAGNYSVKIEDDNGCIDTKVFTLTEPPIVSIITLVEQSPSTANNDGKIEISPNGGTPPYQIIWDNGATGPILDQLTFGIYTAQVIDANGCVDTISYSFSPAPLVLNEIHTDNLCFEDCKGTASVTINGGVQPYSYLWSNGSQDSFLMDLCEGIYSVTIIDFYGNTIQSDLEITNPSVLSSDIITTDISCIDKSDGEININANGGTPPYSYTLNGIISTSNINSLDTGDYDVIITDANNCIYTYATEILSLQKLEPLIEVAHIDCDNKTGAIIINSDNFNNYIFDLDGLVIGSSNQVEALNLQSGIYQLSYSINEECSVSVEEISIEDYTNYSVSVNPNRIIAKSGESFTIEIDIEDPYDLLSKIIWSNNINQESCIIELEIDQCISYEFVLTISDIVKITVEFLNGCVEEFLIPIEIIENFEFDYPNIISPTGDGINDGFSLDFLPENLKIITFDIFDRWGNKVFSLPQGSSNQEAIWDGRFNGSIVEQGVYVYIIELEGTSGKRVIIPGDITVIR